MSRSITWLHIADLHFMEWSFDAKFIFDSFLRDRTTQTTHRRGRLPEVRTKIVLGLVENYGVGVAEIARQVGISTLRGFEDLNANFVQLVNSVISHHIPRAYSPSFSQ